MTQTSNVVVTGTGAVCGAGMSPEDILDAIVAGRSAIAPIRQWDTAGWPCRVAAEISDFNQAMGTQFSDEEFDTVGGLVISHFGRVPKRGEQVSFDGLAFQVLRSDSRRLHVLLVEKAKDSSKDDDGRIRADE